MMDNKAAPSSLAPFLLPLLIALGLGLFLVTLMPATMFWDRDEAFYARAAVEMMQSGNWIVPTYNDAVFADKPPLIYWLMAGAMRLFGENEFGARFVSAPANAASAFLIFLIGSRLFGRRAGLFAMLAFASATLSIYLGITAMLDAVLIAFICLALWAFVAIVQEPRHFWIKAIVFGLAIGFSMLAKGPVGPSVVIPAVAFTWLFLKRGERPPFWRMAVLAVAALAGLGMFLAWVIPANTMSGGVMLSSGFGVHVFGRALHPMEGHGGSGIGGYLATLPVYIPVILIGFMPATLFLPSALSALVGKSGIEPLPRRFLLAWIVPGFVLFSLAATKLPHYIVPIFPALALAAGAVIDDRANTGALAVKTGRWLYLAQTFGLTVVLLAGALWAPGAILKVTLALLAVAVAVFAVRIARLQGEERPAAALVLALVSVVLIMETAFGYVIPRTEGAIKLSKPVAEAVRQNFKPGTPVNSAGYLEPSLVFYLGWPVGSPIRPVEENEAGYRTLLAVAAEQVLIATQQDFDAIKALDTGNRIAKIGAWSAYNTNANGALQTIVVARITAKP